MKERLRRLTGKQNLSEFWLTKIGMISDALTHLKQAETRTLVRLAATSSATAATAATSSATATTAATAAIADVWLENSRKKTAKPVEVKGP